MEPHRSIPPANRMPRIFRTALIGLLLCTLTGCILLPVLNRHRPDECQTYTHSMRLEMLPPRHYGIYHCNTADCLVVFGVVVPAGSLVISGGVVLVGNTLHWIEYQGRCEGSFLKRSLASFRYAIGLEP